MAASFQAAAAESLVGQTRKAVRRFTEQFGTGHALVVAGGVARNQLVRSSLQALADEMSMDLVTPPLPLCTDNAPMIAWAGAEQYWADPDCTMNSLSFAPRPRWPLDPRRTQHFRRCGKGLASTTFAAAAGIAL